MVSEGKTACVQSTKMNLILLVSFHLQCIILLSIHPVTSCDVVTVQVINVVGLFLGILKNYITRRVQKVSSDWP
jgi:hypothetical protein